MLSESIVELKLHRNSIVRWHPSFKTDPIVTKLLVRVMPIDLRCLFRVSLETYFVKTSAGLSVPGILIKDFQNAVLDQVLNE